MSDPILLPVALVHCFLEGVQRLVGIGYIEFPDDDLVGESSGLRGGIEPLPLSEITHGCDYPVAVAGEFESGKQAYAAGSAGNECDFFWQVRLRMGDIVAATTWLRKAAAQVCAVRCFPWR